MHYNARQLTLFVSSEEYVTALRYDDVKCLSDAH